MNKVLYIILTLLLFSLTIISCSPDDTEKVNEPIRKGGDTVNGVLDPVGEGINDGLDTVGDVVNDGVGAITGGTGGGSGTVVSCDVNTNRFCTEHGASVWEFEKK